MSTFLRSLAAIALALGLSLSVTASSFAESPRSEEEQALEVTELNALQIRRKLFQARQSGDKKKIKDLEKQFEKAQKERVRLLRETWQM